MVSPEENREAFAKRLKQAAADAGYPAYGTAARLARALGITPKAVGKWLNGEARPNAEKMESLARLLGVEIGWLAWGTGSMVRIAPHNQQAPLTPEPEGEIVPFSVWDDSTPVDDDEVEVPFLKEVELSAGSGRLALEVSTKAKLRFGKHTLRRYGVQFDKAVCVSVSGNSMEPLLPDGSTVAINTSDQQVVDGKIYALSHYGQLRVKQLYRLPGGGIRLRSFNRDEHPDEEYTLEQMVQAELSILGRVFWSATFYN